MAFAAGAYRHDHHVDQGDQYPQFLRLWDKDCTVPPDYWKMYRFNMNFQTFHGLYPVLLSLRKVLVPKDQVPSTCP